MNFLGVDPIKALIYSAFANGLVAPVILVLIVLISSNRKIMGRWTNNRLTTISGWFITIIMAGAGVAGLISIF